MTATSSFAMPCRRLCSSTFPLLFETGAEGGRGHRRCRFSAGRRAAPPRSGSPQGGRRRNSSRSRSGRFRTPKSDAAPTTSSKRLPLKQLASLSMMHWSRSGPSGRMKEIVLDTETTGLDPDSGDRVVEIGAVELLGHVPTGKHLSPIHKSGARGAQGSGRCAWPDR